MSELLRERVRWFISRHQLLHRGDRVVVAVSGGADSVALLHLLVALKPVLKLTLHVAHLDHGLRDGSREDAEFVAELGRRWDVPVTIERCAVRKRCAEQGWSLEDGARRIRYGFLLEVARQRSTTRIAVAHTADDQAETVLMRLVRGTGLTGLGAIPVQRMLADGVLVVRPLLDVWRREILEHLTVHHLTYREDTTNTDERFLRSRIRHQLLPLLEKNYNPNVKSALTQLAEQSQWDYSYLQTAAQRQWKRLAKMQAPAKVTIAVSLFLRQPRALQRQLVRKAVESIRGDLAQFEFRHWREIERLFVEHRPGTLVHLPGGVELCREPERVTCRLNARSSEVVASE